MCGANGDTIRTSASTASRTTASVSTRSAVVTADADVLAGRPAGGLVAEGVEVVDQLHERRHGAY